MCRILFTSLMKLNTAKLGYTELGYNEQRFCSASTKMTSFVNDPLKNYITLGEKM